MKLRSKFNHVFTNRVCLHCAILKALYGFKKKRVNKARDIYIFFKMFKTRPSRFWKCLNTTWNSPEQPVESTQKLAKDKKTHAHDIFIL